MEDFEKEHIFSLLEKKYGIIGKSQLMKDAMLILYQAAPTDLSVLITGDTGVGKEVFARAFHGLSKRSSAPLVNVNCGAIPETLLESELFGHEKGAFTGATERRKGYFESANHGTIFLDEIGEMPVGTQVKLLRVLESGEFNRLGSSKQHKVDVRILAATNKKLEKAIKEGDFREDLYFRLKSVHIRIPRLRDRPEDIPLLAKRFAKNVCNKLGIDFEGFSFEAINILQSMPWHGNVRELKNLIETMITLEEASYITSEALSKHVPRALPEAKLEPLSKEVALTPIRQAEERTIGSCADSDLILRTLLDLKNEVAEIKRYLHILSLNFRDFKNEMEECSQVSHTIEDDEISFDFDDELNLGSVEKQIIELALKKFNGNRRRAAESLGISERTLYRKISDYGLK